MSRPRRLPIISQEDAFDTICFFESADPWDEQEKMHIDRAIIALRELIIAENRRDKAREYVRNRLENDPEYANYVREYRKQNADRINERRRYVRKMRKKAKEEMSDAEE